MKSEVFREGWKKEEGYDKHLDNFYNRHLQHYLQCGHDHYCLKIRFLQIMSSRISSPRLNISFSFGSLEFITDERGKNRQKDRDLAHIKQN